MADSMRVHSDAPQILTAIKGQLEIHKTANITFTGLGVGGAEAQLSLVSTSLQLPDVKSRLKPITYGSPQVRLNRSHEQERTKQGNVTSADPQLHYEQVGNQAFANYIDANLAGKLTRINNKLDPTPVLPSRFYVLPMIINVPVPWVDGGGVLPYHSASGEIRIDEDNSWQKCLGEDNANVKCLAGAVNAVNEQVYRDHDGRHNGIGIECAT